MKNLFALLPLFLSLNSFAAKLTLNENTIATPLTNIQDSHLRITVAYPGMSVCGIRLSTYNGGPAFGYLTEEIAIVNEYNVADQLPITFSAEVGNGYLDIDLSHLNGSYLGQIGIITKSGETIAEMAKDIFPNSALMISALPCKAL